MRPVPIAICNRFSTYFCSGRVGYSLCELESIFVGYQAEVPLVDHSTPTTKPTYFAECLYSMSPENQRQFLYDLCDDPPSSARTLPDPSIRRELLRLLSQADGVSELGLDLSSLTLHATRNAWDIAASRVTESPSSALTAARSLLETTCKTILTELGKTPDSSGDLGRLWKQTRSVLGIEPGCGATQQINRLVGGLTQVVDGLAGISNIGGDRHGLAGGDRITSLALASLAVHSAGTVALFLVRVHRGNARTSEEAVQQ